MTETAEGEHGGRTEGVSDSPARATSDIEALATQKLRGLNQLIAGVAHEINNPLTSVQGLASLLLAGATDEETREDLKIVVSEVTRAVRIIRDLRAFAGQPNERPQSCSLSRLVAQVADVRGYETRARGIDLSLQLDESLPPIPASPADVLSLVLMLLLRAEQAVMDLGADTGMESRIILTTGLRGDHVLLTVQDNGRHADDPASVVTRALHAAAAELHGTLREETGADGGSLVTVELPADV